MAYDPKDLSVLTYANHFTLWHYRTTDSADTVDCLDYFNPGADMLRAGDLIIANTNTDAMPDADVYLVRRNSYGIVDVVSIIAASAAR